MTSSTAAAQREASTRSMMVAVPTDARPGLEDLYRDHYRSLVQLASLLLDDLGSCEEVVQDAFVTIHRRGLDHVEDGRTQAYLRSAVLNGARSQLRKRQVRQRLRPVPDAPSSPTPERSMLAGEDRRVVLNALRSLPARQRDVLLLRYWADLSEAEIALTLDISPGTVKTHAKRGLAALATRMEDLR